MKSEDATAEMQDVILLEGNRIPLPPSSRHPVRCPPTRHPPCSGPMKLKFGQIRQLNV